MQKYSIFYTVATVLLFFYYFKVIKGIEIQSHKGLFLVSVLLVRLVR